MTANIYPMGYLGKVSPQQCELVHGLRNFHGKALWFGTMEPMATAPTPKGQRRRGQLIEAAGDLLVEGGFDSVRHRSVAERAELPLASTTYYFSSLNALMAAAAAYVWDRDDAAMGDRSEALQRRRRAAPATAEALAGVFVGPETSRDTLSTRFEMMALAHRQPWLAEVLAPRLPRLTDLHSEVLDKSGRVADPDHIGRLIALEDGAVVGALAHGGAEPHAAAREALTHVVDVLAPPIA